MNVDELTFGQVKQINALFGRQDASGDDHWVIGANYAVRTVTHINVGTLVKVTDKELVLVDAAWVADTGRFHQFVAKGEVGEVEPFPDNIPVIMGRGALVDAVEWKHPLLRDQK